MLVDPIQAAVDRPALRVQRVQRGCGFFTGRYAGGTNTRREGSEGNGLEDRGLRLSLALPCSTSRVVVE
jgi:hypothetical protein